MSDFKRSEIEPKVWTREPQDFCPSCGDDRTGKGSLIAAPIGQAFCNELCLMKWQQKRIADLEAQNEMLRAVADDHKRILEQVMNWRVGTMGEMGSVYCDGAFSCDRINKMYQAAIDGGAMEE